MSTPELRALFADLPPGPLLVHSDLLRVQRFVEKCRSPSDLLRKHLDSLLSLGAGRELWFPVFNYDFLKTGRYSPATAPCQVGALGEFVRKLPEAHRTTSPVFSVARVASASQPLQEESWPSHIVEFDQHSVFAKLIELNGSVVFYGAQLSSFTLLHHIEWASGGPLYRYDKCFRGVVGKGGEEHPVEYIYHVRPMGMQLEYDWDRLRADLGNQDALTVHASLPEIFVVHPRPVKERWLEAIGADPFYLLEDRSRATVEEQYARLGRRFKREDFE